MSKRTLIAAMCAWLGASGCFFNPQVKDGDAAATGATSSTDASDTSEPTTGDPCGGDSCVCGDMVCGAQESMTNCPQDCYEPFCGNGAKEADEPCDDGNQVDTDACTNACTLAACGDGVVWSGEEECDDGPDNGLGKACNGTCVVSACGDGDIGPGETCDDGNSVDTDDCTNSCEPAACGDGVVWDWMEVCDDGNDIDTDECTNSCEPASCGDGVVLEGIEACDDGNDIDTDACTNACEPAVCGDGVLQEGVEECDDGNKVDGDGCSKDCLGQDCGNNLVEGNEACDGTDLDGKKCSDFGDYAGGIIKCSPSCTFDVTSCCKANGASCGSGAECCSGNCPLLGFKCAA